MPRGNLTIAQVAYYAYWAFKGRHGNEPGLRKLATFIAICKAENRNLDPDAVHRNNNGTIDVGLWQINSIHFSGEGVFTETNMHDPEMNATAAVMIEEDSGFRAWTTYRVGAYTAYMPMAIAAARIQLGAPGKAPNEIPKEQCPEGQWNPNKTKDFPNGYCCPESSHYDPKKKSCVDDKGSPVIPGSGLLKGLEAIGHFFAWLTQRESWYRIFFVAVGLGLFLYALSRLAKELEVKPFAVLQRFPTRKGGM